MTISRNLFPQGHAIGEAFCGRIREKKRLAESFNSGEHLLITAPRRYGKSSLIRQVLLEMEIPGERIDFLPATNVDFIHKAIKLAVTDLTNKIVPTNKRAKQRLADFLNKYHPKMIFSLLGQKLEIGTKTTPESGITDLLNSLNTVAKEINCRVVFCMDEFQQVGELKDYHTLEASIRSAVETSTHVTYVFSGSNRHLLNYMFNNDSRPLYHLCETIYLDKISKDEYFPFLSKLAQDKWNKMPGISVIEEILNLTKCHPYYVNALCRHLWRLSSIPYINTVQKTWMEYVNSQGNWITDDLSRLTPNQRNILVSLAYKPTNEPCSQSFLHMIKMGASSASKTLAFLLDNDFIFKDNNDYSKVLDPAIETYIHTIEYFGFLGK